SPAKKNNGKERNGDQQYGKENNEHKTESYYLRPEKGYAANRRVKRVSACPFCAAGARPFTARPDGALSPPETTTGYPIILRITVETSV
ncbi:hypothetical protein ACUF6K_004438, partial [Enterobacter hormaechei]